MLFRSLLLIFLIVNSNAQLLPPVKNILQNHLYIFQKAVKAGDKKALREMMPIDQNYDKELDDFNESHKSMKITAKSAKFISTGIFGVVEYASGSAAILVEMVVEKNRSSPSSYKLVSVRTQAEPSQRQNFPNIPLGLFFWFQQIAKLVKRASEKVLKG